MLNSSDLIFAVGINCTAPRHVLSLVERAVASTDKTIVVYPNSGEGWDAENRRWTAAPPAEDIAALATRWYAAGARGFGGCCRTTPKLIADLRMSVASARV